MKHAVLVALGAAIVLATRPVPAQPRPIDDFFRDFTAEWMRGNPNQATATRYFTGAEQDRLERELTPVNDAYQLTRIALAKRGLAELEAVDRSRLTGSQRVAADVLRWHLDGLVEGEKYRDMSFPFEQNGGVNVNLPGALTINHPLATQKDAENYLAKLAQVDLRMDEALADARRLASAGMIPPRFILRATITQMQQFTTTPAAANPFVTAFLERLTAIPGMTAATGNRLRAEAERIVRAEVYPAWQRATAFLEPLLAQASDDAGLWRFKNGAEAYAYNLRRFTTTTLTADEIHQIGLRLVGEIEAEMDGLLRKLGRTEGTVQERIQQLQKDQAYPLTEAGRAAIMVDVERFMRDAEKRAVSDFERQPTAPVVARAYPSSGRPTPRPATACPLRTVRGPAPSRFPCGPIA